MRALLTSGIKAILAVAALSTAAHWALRVQREAAPVASIPDPVATGSIEPRPIERPLAALGTSASAAPSALPSPPSPLPRSAASPPSGLDQSHLAALIAGATPPKAAVAKVAKLATKTASAEKAPAAEKGAARR